jgi:hypothetical protein
MALGIISPAHDHLNPKAAQEGSYTGGRGKNNLQGTEARRRERQRERRGFEHEHIEPYLLPIR